MDPIENAVELFQRGYSCSQSIFASFAPQSGLEKETALKIASTLGGGMARMGEVCGAVSGALMVLGLKYGNSGEPDPELKDMLYALAQNYMNEFQAHNGSILCRDLLGYDLRTPEGRQQVKEKGLTKSICVKLVRDSAKIITKI